MAYVLYILQSDRDGSFYIGDTACLAERLRRHNEGRSRYTRAKIPWSLVFKELPNGTRSVERNLLSSRYLPCR